LARKKRAEAIREARSAPELWSYAVPAGKLFSAHLQEASHRILARTVDVASGELTAREKECLFWTAEGKTAWETSKILAVSERTVCYHIQNAMAKLCASNRVQAATLAVGNLLLDPEVQSRQERPGPKSLLEFPGGRMEEPR
jgi:DNA-binding CsgD family transcriptional regulator